MKCGVEPPLRLVDTTHLEGLNEVAVSAELIQIGAVAKMSHVAGNKAIQNHAPVISEALWRAESPQLRNMALIGGNLTQRTRCTYVCDPVGLSRLQQAYARIWLCCAQRLKP